MERLLPAVEEFWRYAERDDAARCRPDWLARLDVDLPGAGGGIADVVRDLTDVIIPNGSRISEPGFTGFITTGPTTSAMAAWLASAAAGGQRYMVQAFNHLEQVDWTGSPNSAAFRSATRGCSPAAVRPRTWSRSARPGSGRSNSAASTYPRTGYPAEYRSRVYASEQAHHTIQRSTGVLGIGRAGTWHVPCDAQAGSTSRRCGRALTDDQRDEVLPVAVVGIAGTTDTGAIDPLDDLAEVARDSAPGSMSTAHTA